MLVLRAARRKVLHLVQDVSHAAPCHSVLVVIGQLLELIKDAFEAGRFVLLLLLFLPPLANIPTAHINTVLFVEELHDFLGNTLCHMLSLIACLPHSVERDHALVTLVNVRVILGNGEVRGVNEMFGGALRPVGVIHDMLGGGGIMRWDGGWSVGDARCVGYSGGVRHTRGVTPAGCMRGTSRGVGAWSMSCSGRVGLVGRGAVTHTRGVCRRRGGGRPLRLYGG